MAVVPFDLSDEALQGLAIFFVTISNGLNIFSWDVGEESLDKNLCILTCFGSPKVLKERLSKLLEPSNASGESLGVNDRFLFHFTFSQLKSAFHNASFPKNALYHNWLF